LQIALKGVEVNKNLVTARAGEDWDAFCAFCVERNLAGIECLSGIPGLVGGTPVQNVGAYGQEVSETIVKVRVYDRKSKEILELDNRDCRFAYRASIYNTTEKNRFVVLAVTFNLEVKGEPKIVYKDLIQYFNDKKNKNPSLREAREAVLEIRRQKSMVIDVNDPNSKSAGSFFKNPIVSHKKFAEISNESGLTIPYYPFDEKNVKIPAAWLIENSGFSKGYRSGNAGISTKHTLAIINLGNASAADLIALKDEIEARVQKRFGISLKPEPVFIGF
jgi:UDP-N-acetylmuramate dehydrogenase